LLAKGKQIQVVGSLNLREYEKDGVKRQANDLDVDDFKMIGPREDAAPKTAPAPQAGGYEEDDIPF
jgi:single-stranded DNA-binding protein